MIRNKDRLCITREAQVLVYIKVEGAVGKSCVINVWEMCFILLNKKNEFMILALIRCATESIGDSKVVW